MEQIDFTKAAGKTIREVLEKRFYEEWLVVYTDSTFSLIEIEQGYDNDSALEEAGSFRRQDWPVADMLRLGFMTQEEADLQAAKEQEEAKRREEQRVSMERADYERLKAKFESKQEQGA